MTSKHHTLRGTIGGKTRKVVLENSLSGVGWKITKFDVIPNNLEAAPYCVCKLFTDDQGGSVTYSDMFDNRAIGWGAAERASRYSVIDPHHVIRGNLTVLSLTPESASYLIHLESMTLTDTEEVMALIKERSQDDVE